jgi:hypothetical protein
LDSFAHPTTNRIFSKQELQGNNLQSPHQAMLLEMTGLTDTMIADGVRDRGPTSITYNLGLILRKRI